MLSNVPTFDDVNRAYEYLLQIVLNNGAEVDPRRQETLEMGPVSMVVKKPSANVLNVPIRRLNPYFMCAEWMWIMAGMDDVAPLVAFMPSIAKFLDDHPAWKGKTFGAYGPRFVQQLPFVIDTLRRDQNSRQAVMTFWRPDIWNGGHQNTFDDHRIDSKDVPCTICLQFMIRDDKLYLNVFMRSNDLWLGFPYDFFSFTQIQKYVAAKLKVVLGSYSHTVGSMHLYTRDHYKAWACLKFMQVKGQVKPLYPVNFHDKMAQASHEDFAWMLNILSDPLRGVHWDDTENPLYEYCEVLKSRWTGQKQTLNVTWQQMVEAYNAP